MHDDIPPEDPDISDLKAEVDFIDEGDDMINIDTDSSDSDDEMNELQELENISQELEEINRLYISEMQHIISKLTEWAEMRSGLQEQELLESDVDINISNLFPDLDAISDTEFIGNDEEN